MTPALLSRTRQFVARHTTGLQGGRRRGPPTASPLADLCSCRPLSVRYVTRTERTSTRPRDFTGPAANLSNQSSKEQDAMYNRVLSIKVRELAFVPCRGLTALEPNQALARVPTHLRSDPLNVFNDYGSSLDVVSDCLEAYIAQVQIHPRKQARARYTADQTSTKALHWWLASGHEQATQADPQELRFIRALSFTAVGAGVDQDIWEYCTTVSGPLPNDRYRQTPAGWQRRGDALRWLLEAYSYWTEKHDRLEPAYNALFRAMKKHVARFNPAGNWLMRALHTEARFDFSVPSYEKVIASTRVWQPNRTVVSYHQAVLSLQHPASPNPGPALTWLREAVHSTDIFVKDTLRPKAPAYQWAFYWFTVRLAQTLDRQGANADARFVIDIAKDASPLYEFYKGKPVRSLGESSPEDLYFPRASQHHLKGNVVYDGDGKVHDWQRLRAQHALRSR